MNKNSQKDQGLGATKGSYTGLRFLKARRIWWKIRYFRATCAVKGNGCSLEFFYNSPTMKRLLQTHYTEGQFFDSFLSELREGDAVWDIGAAIGLYTVFSGKIIGPSGTVLAFEPMKNRSAQVLKNAKKNSLDNIRLCQIALSNESSTGYIDGEQVVKTNNGSVQLERGDNLVLDGEIPAPNVIKLDVEGAEWHVLDGMREILAHESCRFLAMEVHPRLLGEKCPQDIEQLLSETGFYIYSRFRRGGEEHWLARRA